MYKRQLKPTECGLEGTDADYVIWDPAQGKPVVLEYPMNEGVTPPLFGTYEIDGKQYPCLLYTSRCV